MTMTIKDLVSKKLVDDQSMIRVMKPSFVGFDIFSGVWFDDTVLRVFNKPIQTIIWEEDEVTVVLSA